MAVFRIEKNRDFTIMSNHHLRNQALSLKAKGLQSMMLSLPESWDFTLAGLAHICQDGISSVRSGVAELERHGYLTRRRIREANGQLSDIEYTIHEIPEKPAETDGSGTAQPTDCPADNFPPVCEKPTSQKPICENPTLVIPMCANRTESSTYSNQELNNQNTNESRIRQSIGADAPDTMDAMDVYREILKGNIGYGILCDINRHVDPEHRRNYRNGTGEIKNRGVIAINESGL